MFSLLEVEVLSKGTALVPLILNYYTMSLPLIRISTQLLSLGLCCFWPLFGSGQYHFHVRVLASQAFEGKILYLIKDNSELQNKKFIADSARITNGVWEIKGEMDEPCNKARLRIVVNNIACETRFVIDTGMIDIILDSIESVRYLSFQTPRTPSNLLYKRINDIRTRYYDEYRRVTGKLQGAITLPDEKILLADLEVFDLLKANKHMYYSLLALNDISRYPWMYKRDSLILDVFDSLDDNVKQTPFGQKLLAEKSRNIAKLRSLEAGKTVHTFSVKTPKGSLFSNLFLLGKPYLIVFSATWCVPCIREQPKIHALHEKYRNKGLKIVYFNLDDDRERWLKNVKERTASWINVSEGTKFNQSDIARMFTVVSIPSAILVDTNGIIIYTAINENPNFEKIDYLVGKL